MKRKRAWTIVVYILSACVTVALGGCAGSGDGKQEVDTVQSLQVTPLEQHYSEIIVYELASTPEFKRDYEQELKDCQSTLISSLQTRNKYKKVAAGNSNEKYGSSALLVKIKVNDMRIASFGARFWAGAMAGSSYMYMTMKLVDPATGALVREQDFNSTNSAWAAGWNLGATDRSLPLDMAEIMADYLDKTVQP